MNINLNDEKKKLESLVNAPEDFVRHLTKLSIEFRKDDEPFNKFVIDVINKHQVDLLAYASNAVRSGVDVFGVADLLSRLIIIIPEVNVESFFGLISVFSEKMKGDMMAGMFFEPVVNWAKKNKIKAESLQELILERKSSELYGYVVATIIGISDIDFESSIKKVETLLSDEDEKIVAAGLRAIGGLSNISKENEKQILSFLSKHLNSTNPILAAGSIYSCGRLLEFFPQLRDEIVKASKSNHIEVRFEVSNLLRLRFDKNADWARESFLNLSDIDFQYGGIIQALDSILYKILREGEDLDLAERFVDRWVSSHEFTRNREKFDDVFGMAFSQLFNHRTLVETLLTNWFNSDEIKFHIHARDIIDFMKLHKMSPPSFEPTLIAKYSEKDILYVVRKVIGHLFDFNMSASLLFSLLKHPSISNKSKSLVATVFVEHLGYNYAYETINFCEDKLKSKGLSPAEQEVTEIILKNVKKRFEDLKNLPRLMELRPKMDDVILIEKEKDKQMAKIMNQARSKKSILDLVTNISIKEGRSWFSFMHGKYGDISRMKNLSESVTLPKGDVMDVVKASLDRQGFRLAKRDHK